MIELEYQNPRHIEPRRRSARGWLYFGGAVGAVVAGCLTWIWLATFFPIGRWEILEPPDELPCDMVGGTIVLAISAAIYLPFASREQNARQHLLHGVIAGLLLMTVTNFLARVDPQGAPESLLVAIYFGSFLITPIILGCLSRYCAKKQESIDQSVHRPSA